MASVNRPQVALFLAGWVTAAACANGVSPATPARSSEVSPDESSGWVASLRAVSCVSPMAKQEEAVEYHAGRFRRELDKGTSPQEATIVVGRTVGQSSVSLRGYRLGAVGALAEISVSCEPGGTPHATWLYTFRRGGTTWNQVQSEKSSGPGVPAVLAVGTKVPRFALLTTSEGMGHSVARLEVRNLELGTDHRIADGWDPVCNPDGAKATVRWRRIPTHLDVEIDGPGTIDEVVAVDLDSSQPLRVVSHSPWLNAVDASCALSDAESFCNGSIIDDRATDIGHDVVVQVERPVACSVVPAAPPMRWADDARVVVTVAKGAEWRVVQVRPANRNCAVYGFRAGEALGPSVESARVPLPSTAYAVGALADKASVATRDGLVAVDGLRGRAVRTGLALRDVALLPDGNPVWIDSDGNVAMWRSARVVVLAQDPDAVAVTACEGGVCWTAYSAGEVRRWRGGKTSVLASGLNEPLGIAATDGDLLIATATGVAVLRPGAGQAEDIVAAVEPLDVATHRGALAWIEPNGRVVVRRGGERGWRDATHSIMFSGGRPASVALTSRFVYWVDGETGTLRRVEY